MALAAVISELDRVLIEACIVFEDARGAAGLPERLAALRLA